MKFFLIISAIGLTSLTFAACNNNTKTSAGNGGKDTASSVATASFDKNSGSKPTEAVKGLVASYLQLKNSLAADNSSQAAMAGAALAEGFDKFDKSALTNAQKKSFQDIADDAKEMAEHIGKSADKLPHQREHFDMLSKDMYDLVKLLGAGQPLYVDRCPMYNDKKGAIWLSEVKEIKNPYLGSKMPDCGSIEETLK